MLAFPKHIFPEHPLLTECLGAGGMFSGLEEVHLLGIPLLLHMDPEGRDAQSSPLNCVLWLREKYMVLVVYYLFAGD